MNHENSLLIKTEACKSTHGQLGSTNSDGDDFTRCRIDKRIGISLILYDEWFYNRRSAKLNRKGMGIQHLHNAKYSDLILLRRINATLKRSEEYFLKVFFENVHILTHMTIGTG